MKLKCIGGPNDGEYWDTYNDNPKIGEEVRTYKPSTEINFGPVTITNYNIYVVSLFKYNMDGFIDEYLFLRLSSTNLRNIFDRIFR